MRSRPREQKRPGSGEQGWRDRRVLITGGALIALFMLAGTLFVVVRIGSDDTDNSGDGNQCVGSTCTFAPVDPKPGVIPQLPPSSAPAEEAGTASITDVRSQDGKPGIASRALIQVEVRKMPTNGNRLFLVCTLLEEASNTNRTFVRAELKVTGSQSLPVTFGGPAVDDPTIVNTRRTCQVVTADAAASGTLTQLVGANDAYEGSTALPTGSVIVGAPVTVQVTRLNDFG